MPVDEPSLITEREICELMIHYPGDARRVDRGLDAAAVQHCERIPFDRERLIEILRANPEMADGWWFWSGDKRRAGWFFTDDAQKSYKVGYCEGGAFSYTSYYDDKALACANFILKELEHTYKWMPKG